MYTHIYYYVNYLVGKKKNCLNIIRFTCSWTIINAIKLIRQQCYNFFKFEW